MPPAREAARRLIARADVVLENFRPGRHGAPRPRLRQRARAATAHGLLLGVGLRPAQPAARLAGHRQHRAGHQRHDDIERRAGRRSHARRISGRRHAHWPDGGLRDPRGAAAQRAHWRWRAHRRRDVRCGHCFHGIGRRSVSRDRPRVWRAPATSATAASPPRACS